MLYVPLRNQHLIRTTLPTSWGFIPAPTSPPATAAPAGRQVGNKSDFERLFDFVATDDTTAFLCIPEAIKFRNEVCGGDHRIYAYLDQLANEAADTVASALGTQVMQETTKSAESSQMRRCSMTTVRLPFAVENDRGSDSPSPSEYPSPYPAFKKSELPAVVDFILTTLVDKYATYVPVFVYSGALWTRLSAQIYLEKSDFEWLAGVLKDICDAVGKRTVDLK